jgi:Dockerin type I domain
LEENIKYHTGLLSLELCDDPRPKLRRIPRKPFRLPSLPPTPQTPPRYPCIELAILGNVGSCPPPKVPQAVDPNEKLGASGYGTKGYIPAGTLIPYRINFENLGPGSVPTPAQPATAPAQRVEVTDQLSDNLNWNTLEFTEFGFGDMLVTVPAGRANHFDTLSLTYNNKTFDVQVELTFDAETGMVRAVYQTLDPGTSLPPEVLTGFLPPEDGTGIGQAHFSYTIQTKAGLATGTELRNIALIRFDGQTSIATNQVNPQDPSKGTDLAKEARNTIDSGSPTSSITSLPAQQNAIFTVNWSGADDTGGSGLAGFHVFVSDNGGPFTAFQTNTLTTSASFTGQAGHTYSFYTVATDNVGHVEAVPGTPDASTQISTHPWHNVVNSLDVIGPGGQPDGIVVPGDALEIINYINAFGAGEVPSSAISGPPYYDTSGDDHVAPADALAVINFINAFGSGLPGPAGEGEGSAARPSTGLVAVTAMNAAAQLADVVLSAVVFAEASNTSASQPPLAPVPSPSILAPRRPSDQEGSPPAALAPSSRVSLGKVSTAALDEFFTELASKPGNRSRPTARLRQLCRHV